MKRAAKNLHRPHLSVLVRTDRDPAGVLVQRGKEPVGVFRLFIEMVSGAVPRRGNAQRAQKHAHPRRDRLGRLDRDGHGRRRGHEQAAQQISARRARHGDRHPHDESGHHHRHLADAHVRVLRPADRRVHEPRLLVDARGAHHVLPAVCHHAGAAEAAADGPRAARGRDGSRLHAGARSSAWRCRRSCPASSPA